MTIETWQTDRFETVDLTRDDPRIVAIATAEAPQLRVAEVEPVHTDDDDLADAVGQHRLPGAGRAGDAEGRSLTPLGQPAGASDQSSIDDSRGMRGRY